MYKLTTLLLALALSNFAIAAKNDDRGRSARAANTGCNTHSAGANRNCPTVDLSCTITKTGFFVPVVHIIVSNAGPSDASDIGISGNNGYSTSIAALAANASFKQEIHADTAIYNVASAQKDDNAANNECNI